VRRGSSREFALQLKISVLMSVYHQKYEDIIKMPKKAVNFYYELAYAENKYLNKKGKK